MLRIIPASNLSVVSAKAMMVTESLRCPSTCSSTAHHQKIVRTSCKTLDPILATCRPHLRTAEADTSTQTRRSPAPVVMELLHSSPLLSLQLATKHVPAVSPELVARLPLLGLRRFILYRSTHSCLQGSAAIPPFFNSFSTFRADHGTSMSFARPDHTTPIPLPRLRNH